MAEKASCESSNRQASFEAIGTWSKYSFDRIGNFRRPKNDQSRIPQTLVQSDFSPSKQGLAKILSAKNILWLITYDSSVCLLNAAHSSLLKFKIGVKALKINLKNINLKINQRRIFNEPTKKFINSTKIFKVTFNEK